jgi:hypothetical protein
MRLAWLLLLAPLGAACEKNPLYCDGTAARRCLDPSRPYCNVDKNECESTPQGGDMAMCVASDCHVNMDMGDGGSSMCTTGCMDMAGRPDLMPMCTVATVATSCASAAKPICDATSQTCRQCSSSVDDTQCAAHGNGKNHCNTTSHVCVECNMNSDCTTSTKPVCDTGTNTCRACAANSECPSLGTWPEGGATGGVCNGDGSCATAGSVAFVDNRGINSTCSTVHPSPAGTAADPYCDIAAGVATTKAIVLVEGQTPAATSTYGKVSITANKNVRIVGPGQGAAATAEIYDATNAELNVTLSGAGTNAVVVIDGLVIGDATNSSVQDAIDCSATSGATIKLTIVHSNIQHSSKVGLTATSCDITMDQDIVQNNTAGGISLGSTDFTVQNTVIANNGTTSTSFGGIQMTGNGPAVRAQLINITIADNSAKNQVGDYSAIDCGGTAPAILNAVVANNINTQLNASCTLSYSSYPTGSGTNHDISGCSDAALFVNSGANPYQPLPTAAGKCILVGKGMSANAGVSAPTYDLLGAPRPAMPSDGAYE